MSESAEFELPTQEDFRCDLRALCLGAIRLTLEMLLDEEIRALVGAGRWQRLVGRKDVRNGSYLRRLVTSLGLVELEVPRAREGGSASEVLGRYKRRTRDRRCHHRRGRPRRLDAEDGQGHRGADGQAQ
jgi:putative transposase